jgi:hypothetical protein
MIASMSAPNDRALPPGGPYAGIEGVIASDDNLSAAHRLYGADDRGEQR